MAANKLEGGVLILNNAANITYDDSSLKDDSKKNMIIVDGKINSTVSAINASTLKGKNTLTVNLEGITDNAKLTSIIGGAGNDKIENLGGEGSVPSKLVIDMGAGNDSVVAKEKIKSITLGAGNDTAEVSMTNTIYGGAGNDVVVLSTSDVYGSTIDLGAGNDKITVAEGITNVKVTLGAGNDTVIASSGKSTDSNDIEGAKFEITDYQKGDVIQLVDATKIGADNITISGSGSSTKIIIGGSSTDTWDKTDNTGTELASPTNITTSEAPLTYTLSNIIVTKHTFKLVDSTTNKYKDTEEIETIASLTVTVNGKDGSIASVKEDGNDVSTTVIKESAVTSSNVVYYSGIKWDSGKNAKLTIDKGPGWAATNPQNPRNLIYTFAPITKDGDDYKVAKVVPTWTTTESLNSPEITLSGAADQLVKIVNKEGTVIYEQTASALTGQSANQTYTATQANTGKLLFTNENVKTIATDKNRKADLNITAKGATSVLAGQGADTISTGAEEAIITTGKGADVIIVNKDNNLVVTDFTTGNNAKKADAFKLGTAFAYGQNVTNLTDDADVKDGNVVLQFTGFDQESSATLAAAFEANNNETPEGVPAGTEKPVPTATATVTIQGAYWDGLAAGKEILIYKPDGSDLRKVAFGDKDETVISGTDTDITANELGTKYNLGTDIKHVNFAGVNKSQNVTGGEKYAVTAGKGKDVVIGNPDYYATEFGTSYYSNIDLLKSNAADLNIAGTTNKDASGNTYKTITVDFNTSSDDTFQWKDITFYAQFSSADTNKKNVTAIFSTYSLSTAADGTVNIVPEDQVGKVDTKNNTIKFTYTDTSSDVIIGVNAPYGRSAQFTFTLKTNDITSADFKTPWLSTVAADQKLGALAPDSGAIVTVKLATAPDNDETVGAGAGNDVIYTNPRGGLFEGGAGNDVITAGVQNLETRKNNITTAGANLFRDSTVRGGAGNDTFIISGEGNVEIQDYTNVVNASDDVGRKLKAAFGADKIVFSNDKAKDAAPLTNVTITGAKFEANDQYNMDYLGVDATVKAAENITLDLKADTYTDDAVVAHTQAGDETVTGGFSGKTQFSTAKLVGLKVGDKITVDYQGVTFTQTIETVKAAQPTGNYLGWLNPNAEKITASGSAVLIGNDKTNTITGSGSKDTLIANAKNATLTGKEGNDEFNVTNGTSVYIADYQPGKDTIKVASLGSANVVAERTVGGVANVGYETFTFKFTTKATAAEGNYSALAAADADVTITRKGAGQSMDSSEISLKFNKEVVHFGTQLGTSFDDGNNNALTFYQGFNKFNANIKGTLGSGYLGTNYTISNLTAYTGFATSAITAFTDATYQTGTYSAFLSTHEIDGVTVPNSFDVKLDGLEFTITFKNDKYTKDNIKSIADSEGNIAKNSFIYGTSAVFQLQDDGFHKIVYNTTANANVFGTSATEVSKANSYYLGKTTVTGKESSSYDSEPFVSINGSDLVIGDNTIKGGKDKAITFVETIDYDVTKNGAITGSKAITRTEVRTFGDKETITGSSNNDIINIYNAEADSKVKVVKAGAKATEIRNASYNVESIFGGAKDDTIYSQGNNANRVKVKTEGGNDVIAADAYVEVTDFAEAKGSKYSKGDIIDFTIANAYLGTGKVDIGNNQEVELTEKDWITTEDVEKLFSDEATPDGNGQTYHRLNVEFEGNNVILGGVKLDNMKGKQAAIRAFTDPEKGEKAITLVKLENSKEYVAGAKETSIDGDSQEGKTAIDSTIVTKGASITMGTNIKTVTAGKGVDTIFLGTQGSQTITGGAGADFFVFGTNFTTSQGTAYITDYDGDKIVLNDDVQLQRVQFSTVDTFISIATGTDKDGYATVASGKGANSVVSHFYNITLNLKDSNGKTAEVVLENVIDTKGVKVTRAGEAGSKTFGAFDYSTEKVATITGSDGTDFDLTGAATKSVTFSNAKAVTVRGASANHAVSDDADEVTTDPVTLNGGSANGAITFIGNEAQISLGSGNYERTVSGDWKKGNVNSNSINLFNGTAPDDTNPAYSWTLKLGNFKYNDPYGSEDKLSAADVFTADSNKDAFVVKLNSAGQILGIYDTESTGSGNVSIEGVTGTSVARTLPGGTEGTGVAITFKESSETDARSMTFTLAADVPYTITRNDTTAFSTTYGAIKNNIISYETPITARAAILGAAASIVGSNKNDVYVGNGAKDTVNFNAGGNNTIYGGRADVSITNSAGNDVIILGADDDVTIDGYGKGSDKIYLDTIFGGAGQIDTVYLNSGDNGNLVIKFKGVEDEETELTPTAKITLKGYKPTASNAVPVYIGQLTLNNKNKLVQTPLSQVKYLGNFASNGNSEIDSIVGSDGKDTMEVGKLGISYVDGGKGNDTFKVYGVPQTVSGPDPTQTITLTTGYDPVTIGGFNVGADEIYFYNDDGETVDFKVKTLDPSYTYTGGENATLHVNRGTEDDPIYQDVILTKVGTSKKTTTAIKVNGVKGVALNDQKDVKITAAKPAVTEYDLSKWRNVSETFDAKAVGAATALTVTANASLKSYVAGKGRDVLYTAKELAEGAEGNASTTDKQIPQQLKYTYTAQGKDVEDVIYIRNQSALNGKNTALPITIDKGSLTYGEVTCDDTNTLHIAMKNGSKDAGTLTLVDSSHDGGVFTYFSSIIGGSATVNGTSEDDRLIEKEAVGVKIKNFTYQTYVIGGPFDKAQAVGDAATMWAAEAQTEFDVSDFNSDGTPVFFDLETAKLGSNDLGSSFGETQYIDYEVELEEKSNHVNYVADASGVIKNEKAIIHVVGDGSGWRIDSIDRYYEDNGDVKKEVCKKSSDKKGFVVGAYTVPINGVAQRTSSAIGGDLDFSLSYYITEDSHAVTEDTHHLSTTRSMEVSFTVPSGGAATTEWSDSGTTTENNLTSTPATTATTATTIAGAVQETGTAQKAISVVIKKNSTSSTGTSEDSITIPTIEDGKSDNTTICTLTGNKKIRITYSASDSATSVTKVEAYQGITTADNFSYSSGSSTFTMGGHTFNVPTTSGNVTWEYDTWTAEWDSSNNPAISTPLNIATAKDVWGADTAVTQVSSTAINGNLTLTSNNVDQAVKVGSLNTSGATGSIIGAISLTWTPVVKTRSFKLRDNTGAEKTYIVAFATDDWGNSKDAAVDSNVSKVYLSTDATTDVREADTNTLIVHSDSTKAKVFTDTTFTIDLANSSITYDKVTNEDTFSLGTGSTKYEYKVNYEVDQFGNSTDSIGSVSANSNSTPGVVSSAWVLNDSKTGGTLTLSTSGDIGCETAVNVTTGTGGKATYNAKLHNQGFTLGGVDYTVVYTTDILGNATNTIEKFTGGSSDITPTNNQFDITDSGIVDKFNVVDGNKITWDANIEGDYFTVGTKYDSTKADGPSKSTTYMIRYPSDAYGNEKAGNSESSGDVTTYYSTTGTVTPTLTPIKTNQGNNFTTTAPQGTRESSTNVLESTFDYTIRASTTNSTTGTVTYNVPQYYTYGSNITTANVGDAICHYYQDEMDEQTESYITAKEAYETAVQNILDGITTLPVNFEERFNDYSEYEVSQLFNTNNLASANDLSEITNTNYSVTTDNNFNNNTTTAKLGDAFLTSNKKK